MFSRLTLFRNCLSGLANGKCRSFPSLPKIRWTTTQNDVKTSTAIASKSKPPWFSDVSPRSRKIVGTWLMGCAGMCFGAVVLGGITRLTGSGVSMTQWHIIKGMKPPSTESEWIAEFERYKTFPKHDHAHSDLTLEEFKMMFLWEYLHRMWGRSVGLVCILPGIVFYARGMITRRMKPRLAVYMILVVFQGWLGWYMVKSGLGRKSDDVNAVPRISQYRLSAHLSTALILYSLFFWSGLTHLLTQIPLPQTRQISRVRWGAHWVKALIFCTAASGAFVSGLDAGRIYNTWPKYADRWIPSDLMSFSHRNLTENPTTVQFTHRNLGEITGLAVLILYMFTRKVPLHPRAKLAANCLVSIVLIQIGLGIATLLTQVNPHVAGTHQAGAVASLSFAMWFAHEFRRLPK